MLKELEDGDWGEVFKYANPTSVIGCEVSTKDFEREGCQANHWDG